MATYNISKPMTARNSGYIELSRDEAQHRAEHRQHHIGCLRSAARNIYTVPMAIPVQPNIKLVNTAEYRENYSNSVQVRVNVWDFFLVFGTLQQQTESEVEVRNFQGVYLSPQQAKALMTILQQNVANYEKTFGEIKLDPRLTAPGVVN